VVTFWYFWTKKNLATLPRNLFANVVESWPKPSHFVTRDDDDDDDEAAKPFFKPFWKT
jgi:hypothetical protein